MQDLKILVPLYKFADQKLCNDFPRQWENVGFKANCQMIVDISIHH